MGRAKRALEIDVAKEAVQLSVVGFVPIAFAVAYTVGEPQVDAARLLNRQKETWWHRIRVSTATRWETASSSVRRGRRR